MAKQKLQQKKAESLMDLYSTILDQRCRVRGLEQSDANAYMLGYTMSVLRGYLEQDSKLRTEMQESIEYMLNYNLEIQQELQGEQV